MFGLGRKKLVSPLSTAVDWLGEKPSTSEGHSITNARKLTNQRACYSCRCGSFTKFSVASRKNFKDGCWILLRVLLRCCSSAI